MVNKDFNATVECKPSGPEVSIDASIFGDIRRVWNDTNSFVELRLDKVDFSEDDFKERKILAVLEPVWGFVARTVDNEIDITKNITVDVSGKEGRKLYIESSRSKEVVLLVHETGSGYIIVELPNQDRKLPDQPSDCQECIGIVNPSFDCTSKFLTNECGAIVDHECAAEWNIVKHLCNTCIVPM